MGDQHIGVPWKDLRIGRDMQWVQVPLCEVENGSYSLSGRVCRRARRDRTPSWCVLRS